MEDKDALRIQWVIDWLREHGRENLSRYLDAEAAEIYREIVADAAYREQVAA